MSDTHHQVVRGPATIADILGTRPSQPTSENVASENGEPPTYTRADIVAESIGRGVRSDLCGSGTFRVDPMFT